MIDYVGLALPARSTALTSYAFGNPDEQRLVDVVDAAGHEWVYGYNALGSLTSVTADDGIVRTFTYNANNLLWKETQPEFGPATQAGTTTYLYDIAGVLATKTDPNGTTTVFERDGNDRIRKVTAGNQITLMTYEAGSDNRKSALKSGVGESWEYDPTTGRLQSRRDVIGGKAFVSAFEYDDNDHLIAIQYPSGRHVQFDVDEAGRPTKVFELAAGR